MQFFTAVLVYGTGAVGAQCLEYDIASQGETGELALQSLARTIQGQMELNATRNRIWSAGFDKAPGLYHEITPKYTICV
jgi:hypothetical protein